MCVRVCVSNVLPHRSVLYYCLYPAASEHHGLFVVSHCFKAGAEALKSLPHPPNEPDEEQSSAFDGRQSPFPAHVPFLKAQAQL